MIIYSNLKFFRVMCDLDFQCKGQRSRSRDLQVTLQVTFLSRALYKLEQ